MKVKFCHNNHANIHSKVERVFDTWKDLGLTGEEWNSMSEDDKYEMVKEWAMQEFEWWYEESEK